MDNRPIFIKQCEKAVEIQKNHKIGFGDLFCYVYDTVIRMERFHTREIMTGEIFLPRQDQLQAMIDWSEFENKIAAMCSQIDDFRYNFPGILDKPKTVKITSMEFLWLAFVMHELYLKRWDSDKEDWVK